MKKLTKLLLVFLVMVFWGTWPLQMAAEDKSPDKILFLHLKFKDGAVTLLKAVSRPGTLKTPPHSRGDIQIEMVSINGQALWTTLTEDPCIQRLEYEDPDNPGQIKRIEHRLPETEFMLRVPFHSKGKQLRLWRKGEKNGVAATASKHIIAEFDIPAIKEAP